MDLVNAAMEFVGASPQRNWVTLEKLVADAAEMLEMLVAAAVTRERLVVAVVLLQTIAE